jgi:hypothetical protein
MKVLKLNAKWHRVREKRGTKYKGPNSVDIHDVGTSWLMGSFEPDAACTTDAATQAIASALLARGHRVSIVSRWNVRGSTELRIKHDHGQKITVGSSIKR